ncbi:MAG: sugar transferase [Desulfobacterales bacterium]|nr:sugar transferase [Desulfobacterales bacterium]
MFSGKEGDFSIVGGYQTVHFALNRVLNIFLALVLIIFHLPFLLIIILIMQVREGRPFFYKGVRLGLGKKPFIMYKFRTLVPQAESIIGPEILSAKHNLATPFGKFLRDTRLDELPQLFNILKGDMDFVGPRPERPIIYEKICKHIKGYDLRFQVKPGLIGYSQLFTPHSAPKAIRTLIDNRFLRKKQKFSGELTIVFVTILVVLKTIAVQIFKIGKGLLRRLAGAPVERRAQERIEIQQATATLEYLDSAGKEQRVTGKLVDINEDYFLLLCDEEIPEVEFSVTLQTIFKAGSWWKRGGKAKRAKCTGTIYFKLDGGSRGYDHSYVIRYEPVSPFNFYMVHQYFLLESVAS